MATLEAHGFTRISMEAEDQNLKKRKMLVLMRNIHKDVKEAFGSHEIVTSLRLRRDVHRAAKQFCFERDIPLYEILEQALVDFLKKNEMNPKLIPKVNIYCVDRGPQKCRVMTCAKRNTTLWIKKRVNPGVDRDEPIGTRARYCEEHSILLPEQGWEIAEE